MVAAVQSTASEQECAAAESAPCAHGDGLSLETKLVGPDEMAARLLHRGLEAERAQVNVGQPLLAQLMTSVSNPGRGLGEVSARCLALLRFRAR